MDVLQVCADSATVFLYETCKKQCTNDTWPVFSSVQLNFISSSQNHQHIDRYAQHFCCGKKYSLQNSNE